DGHAKRAAIEALVKNAVASAIVEQNLDPVASLAKEDEQRARLGVASDALAHPSNEQIERPSEIDRLYGEIDVDVGRQPHVKNSARRIAITRRNVLSSKSAPTVSFAPEREISRVNGDPGTRASPAGGAVSTRAIGIAPTLASRRSMYAQ